MPLLAPPFALAALLLDATGSSLASLLTTKENHSSSFSRTLRNVTTGRHKPRDRTISQIQAKIDDLSLAGPTGAKVDFRSFIQGGVQGDAKPTWESYHQVWLSMVATFPKGLWRLATFWREVIELERQSHEVETLGDSGRHLHAIELLQNHRFAVLPSVSRILELAKPRLPKDEFRNTLGPLHIVTCLYLVACVNVDLPESLLSPALVPYRDKSGEIQRSAKLWYAMLKSQLHWLSKGEFYDFLLPSGSSDTSEREDAHREVRRWIRESRTPPEKRIAKLSKAFADTLAKRRPDLKIDEEPHAYIRMTLGYTRILDELLRHAERMADLGNLKSRFDPIVIFDDFPALEREARIRKIAGAD
jgi:hypothetical protein